MANSNSNIDQISSTQAGKEITANALFDAASPSMLYGRKASGCSGLVFAYYGGIYNGNTIANGSFTLTANTTNYIEADSSTGAVSVNTTGFTAGRIKLYSVITGASTVSSYTDQRDLLSLDWAKIQNKPTSYPPSAHGHAVSDVTGLDTALSSKLDASLATAAGLEVLGAASKAAQRSALELANHQLVSVDSAGNIGVRRTTIGNQDNTEQWTFDAGVYPGYLSLTAEGIAYHWKVSRVGGRHIFGNTPDDGTSIAQFGGNVRATGSIASQRAQGTDARITLETSNLQNTALGFNNSGATNGYGVPNNYSYVGNLNAYGLAFVANGTKFGSISIDGNWQFGNIANDGVSRVQVDGAGRFTGGLIVPDCADDAAAAAAGVPIGAIYRTGTTLKVRAS